MSPSKTGIHTDRGGGTQTYMHVPAAGRVCSAPRPDVIKEVTALPPRNADSRMLRLRSAATSICAGTSSWSWI